MGLIRYTLANVLILITSVTAFNERASAIEPGEKAPEFSLSSSDDKNLSLSDFSGKVVYLDFWASWCGPCRHTLPWMNELQSKFANKNFSVLTVNLDKDSAKVKQIISEQHIQYPVLLDATGSVAKLFQLPTMPASYLINEKGEIALVHPGFRDGDQTVIETAIENLLSKERTK